MVFLLEPVFGSLYLGGYIASLWPEYIPDRESFPERGRRRSEWLKDFERTGFIGRRNLNLVRKQTNRAGLNGQAEIAKCSCGGVTISKEKTQGPDNQA
jgi:hypothetical protein